MGGSANAFAAASAPGLSTARTSPCRFLDDNCELTYSFAAQDRPNPVAGLAGLTSGNLSGLSEYLELVPLPTEALRSDLMGLMAADFCLCWILDKLLTKAFAY